MILKNWVTCGENSMASVGFLLAPSRSAKSTSSAEPAILSPRTARNAGLWVKPPTDTVRGHQKVLSQSLVAKLFKVSSFFVTNNQKSLKIFNKTSKNPEKSPDFCS